MKYLHRKFRSLSGFAASIAVGALAVGLVGCNDTAQGVSKDTQENMEAVEKKGDEVGKDLKRTADDAGSKMEDIGQAAKLTPQIQGAISANPLLNDKDNSINVDTDKDHVWLKGHVSSEAFKADAEQIAKKILTENSATQTVKNELVVKKP